MTLIVELIYSKQGTFSVLVNLVHLLDVIQDSDTQANEFLN